MANHASAEKRNRQRITRTERNRAAKSALRTIVKRARAAAEAGGEGSADLVVAAERALDKAAKKGVIPDNRASRLKGRLKSTKPAAK
ncbi:MAG: 30S ribosomal protein S20 [Myxococcales bacterium]|nr:30S ribosomal protein S20 [Myxococcales bacterium]